ncbi:serine/threonine-protein kinase Nek7-like isoform X2 [Amphiura filiformis]|uniref:serine/threonine-protein kinase Nek7-like isoform X2 n=1 Tax=Amphiura filiformis TaxID=82378 RepID=UPI003B226631
MHYLIMAEDVLLSSKDYKLTLFESLAVGSHSQVFRGELILAGQQPIQVAAKKVRLMSMENTELRALKSLNHKNIIKFHGVYAFDEVKTFIIMELAEEGDLYHFLIRYRLNKEKSGEISRLPEPLVWRWVLEAASAIQYLHSGSKIHRDIKSQNYLISANFTLKLGDLGMAKVMDATQPTLGSGTCGWMAPEVIQHQRRSRKSDVFSFGIVAWEICSTDVPYCDIKGDFKVMRAVCDGARPTIPGDIPEKLACLMRECWEKDYNKRPEMDVVVVRLLPHQTEVDIPKIVETKLQDALLKAVSPPASITRLEPDESSIDKVLTDMCLLDLAGQLGHEWEQLGTYLEFDSSEIYRLKCENQTNILTAVHKMLISWRQRQDPDHGVKQVVENLSQALGSCGRKDVARKVLKVIPKR